MNTENTALMDMAERSLKGKWGLAIGTCLVYLLITGGLSLSFHINSYLKISLCVSSLIFGGPMAYGMSFFSLSLSRTEDARFEQLFKGFSRFGTYLMAYLYMGLLILLWTLLLIVPGIIAAISYSQTFFVLAEDDTIEIEQAIGKSIKMMDGYKWKYFRLCLRFFALGLLCILTLGIGFLWLMPYIQITNAKFYDDIRGNIAG